MSDSWKDFFRWLVSDSFLFGVVVGMFLMALRLRWHRPRSVTSFDLVVIPNAKTKGGDNMNKIFQLIAAGYTLALGNFKTADGTVVDINAELAAGAKIAYSNSNPALLNLQVAEDTLSAQALPVDPTLKLQGVAVVTITFTNADGTPGGVGTATFSSVPDVASFEVNATANTPPPPAAAATDASAGAQP